MALTAPKKKRKLLVAILVAVLLTGAGTAGWFAWNSTETSRQAEAKAAAEQKTVEDAATAKASADRAAVTKAIADTGWSEKAPGIYYAASPDHTFDYTAWAKFTIMTTPESVCPDGIVIRDAG